MSDLDGLFDAGECHVLERIMALRRDVRGNRFTDQAVDEASVDRIIDAALHAPSVGYSQPWEFVIVRDAKTRQRSIVIRHKTATSQLAARKHIHDDKIDEMLFRFENAERRIDSVEAQGESLDIGRRKGLAEEIAGLEDDERVEDALTALKAKVSKSDQPDKTEQEK